MSLPIALVVTQWVMLFALVALVVMMYRQLAHLLEIGSRAHDAGGLADGDPAPSFGYRRPGEPGTHHFTGGGSPALLLFTDPRCGACEQALESVEALTRGNRVPDLRVLVVTDADDVAVTANEGLSRTRLDVAVVDNHVVTRDYRVAGTPLLVGIDAAGVVRTKVAGADAAAVRRFFADFRRTLARRDGGGPAPAAVDREEVRSE
jgi:hypothetical protein